MKFKNGLPKQVYILVDHRIGSVYNFTTVKSRRAYSKMLYWGSADREKYLTVGTYVPKCIK